MRNVSLLFHDVYDADPRESGFASDAADRYKLPVTDFEAQLAGLTRYHRDQFRITVDDGGLSYYTHIADRLERHGWRGICFVTTNQIATPGFLDAPMLRELDKRGHVIGTHSVSHPLRFSALTPEAMQREWGLSRAILEDILGHPVTVGSVPGGYFSHTVTKAAGEAGLHTLFTSEPTTSVTSEYGCTVLGRFTIRHGDSNDLAQRLVASAPWARWAAWASWNAKGLVKPLLGTNYMRIADWLLRRPELRKPEGFRLPRRSW
jgi:peptidoglycan/xylan/chitin deacetylase (PgdA/CDA1 family)